MTESRHINYDNYESWFLLYVDNELSETQKQQVIQFVKQNPQLVPELNALLATINITDDHIVFAKKNNLIKNKEEIEFTDKQLILFLDGESDYSLSEKIRADRSAHIQERLKQLKKTYSIADTSITYNKKENLYKQSKTAALYYWFPRVAAAAAVLVLGFWIIDSVRFNASKEEAQITKGSSKALPDLYKPSADTPAAPAIAKDAIVIKENPGIDRNSAIIADGNLEKKKLMAKAYAQKSVLPEKSATSFPLPPDQKPVQPETLAKNEVPVITEKKDIASLAELPVHPVSEAVAVAQPVSEKKRNSFFKNISEKIRERAIEVLSDDNENIIVAGLAINIRK